MLLCKKTGFKPWRVSTALTAVCMWRAADYAQEAERWKRSPDVWETPRRPSTFVMYAGNNEVWLGKPADITAQHFKDIVAKMGARSYGRFMTHVDRNLASPSISCATEQGI